MGGAVSAGHDNDGLIDNLIEGDYIKSESVETFFRCVDRGNYYLQDCRKSAYRDLAWKFGHIHLSAPCIYCEVMEHLELRPGLSFLNLGSGTGYLSTMVGLALGSNGTNHGVELHEDNVEYAKERLAEFVNKSPAFDKHEFCVPEFVTGNCLQIKEKQLYDRVYCGASCPTDLEDYMKGFIKVGGHLLMPCEDFLMKVTRHDEDRYEFQPLVPVSFAKLIRPEIDSKETVKLPEMRSLPLPLQELCRLSVRAILRQHIKVEPSQLRVNRSGKNPRKSKKKLIPLPHGSSYFRYNPDSDDEENEDGNTAPNTDSSTENERPPAEQGAYGSNSSHAHEPVRERETHGTFRSSTHRQRIQRFRYSFKREPEERASSAVAEERSTFEHISQVLASVLAKPVVQVELVNSDQASEEAPKGATESMEEEIDSKQDMDQDCSGNGDSGIDNNDGMSEDCDLKETESKCNTSRKRSVEKDNNPSDASIGSSETDNANGVSADCDLKEAESKCNTFQKRSVDEDNNPSDASIGDSGIDNVDGMSEDCDQKETESTCNTSQKRSAEEDNNPSDASIGTYITYKRVALEGTSSDDVDSDSGLFPSRYIQAACAGRCDSDSDVEDLDRTTFLEEIEVYSRQMKEMVHALPVPPLVKSFLNYGKPLD